MSKVVTRLWIHSPLVTLPAPSEDGSSPSSADKSSALSFPVSPSVSSVTASVVMPRIILFSVDSSVSVVGSSDSSVNTLSDPLISESSSGLCAYTLPSAGSTVKTIAIVNRIAKPRFAIVLHFMCFIYSSSPFPFYFSIYFTFNFICKFIIDIFMYL